MKERILLIDYDSKIPNLSLMKISSYYKARGGEVGFNITDPTKIYISCIFKKNKSKLKSTLMMLGFQFPGVPVDVGGSGWDLHKELPAEIYNCKPDYDLYPKCDYDLGFTTRGCIRKCPFCIVHIKEGGFKINQHPKEFHDPSHKKVILMDNNILCDKKWFFEVTDWIMENNLKVDFNQGLDVRLMDDDIAKRLCELKPVDCWHFAFDSLRYEPQVRNTLELLQKHGMKTAHKVLFYVYCDNSDGEYGFDSALKRCRLLKELGGMPYVMLNRDTKPNPRNMQLKFWANCPYYFFPYDFDEYMDWMGKAEKDRSKDTKLFEDDEG